MGGKPFFSLQHIDRIDVDGEPHRCREFDSSLERRQQPVQVGAAHGFKEDLPPVAAADLCQRRRCRSQDCDPAPQFLPDRLQESGGRFRPFSTAAPLLPEKMSAARCAKGG